MGVIARQTLLSSFVNYTGVLIGFFSSIYIFPLEFELYGTIQYWIATATILSPVLSMGSTALVNKYFPYFKANEIPGFLGMIFLITGATIFVATTLILIAGLALSDSSFLDGIGVLNDNFSGVIVLSIVMIFFNILQLHIANSLKIVLPEIYGKIVFRVFLSGIILLVYFDLLEMRWALPGLIIFHLVGIILLVAYSIRLNQFHFRGFKWSKLPKNVRKDIRNFWIFGGFNQLGAMVAMKIDLFMIGSMIDDKSSVGIYSIFLFLSNIIVMPLNSINQVAAPIISTSFDKGDMENINSIYKKSSDTMLIFGSILLVTIWFNLYHFLDVMKNGNELLPFVGVFFFLGCTKLFDLGTSVNNLVIVYSKWYRYNLLFLVLMSVLNIILNIPLISYFGIQGAALATFISIVVYNLIKMVFIYKKMNVHPFSIDTLKILSLFIVGFAISSFCQHIKLFNEPIFNLAFFSMICGVVLTLTYYIINVSKEFNDMIDSLIFNKFKK